ncbi:hypothetical protein PROFUN_08524 [Planoprotostelium fungivorum]|uniref:Uncharacterized protein n=1 Tax=Planoprotostelium fungivorum TaxID=1890364 RepID=A0A2P6NJE7_9EUKA|nr:hypothetical protein PROFUN_08524 [Planoprotostelium fungivorum]
MQNPKKGKHNFACLACRAAHTCSRPCSRCTRLGKECIEAPVPKKRRSDDRDSYSDTSSPIPSASVIELPQFFTMHTLLHHQQSHITSQHSFSNSEPPSLQAESTYSVDSFTSNEGTPREHGDFYSQLAMLFVNRRQLLKEPVEKDLEVKRVCYNKLNSSQEQKRIIDLSPIPCVLFSLWKTVAHANSAFVHLSGWSLEQLCELDAIECIGLFDYHPKDIRIMIWSASGDAEPLVASCYLQTSVPSDKFKTERRHGLDFVKGISWTQTNPFSHAVYFMPAPI